MPIAFPIPDRGPDYNYSTALSTFAPAFDLTNLGGVGVEFGMDSLAPGLPGCCAAPVNLRNMGYDYEAVDFASRVNPVPCPVADPRFFTVQLDYKSYSLSGISRDSAGSVLGNCVVQLFRTANDELLQEVTSDASGNFWFSLMPPGPYYLVAYKAGGTDVAGTTLNTLNPS